MLEFTGLDSLDFQVDLTILPRGYLAQNPGDAVCRKVIVPRGIGGQGPEPGRQVVPQRHIRCGRFAGIGDLEGVQSLALQETQFGSGDLQIQVGPQDGNRFLAVDAQTGVPLGLCLAALCSAGPGRAVEGNRPCFTRLKVADLKIHRLTPFADQALGENVVHLHLLGRSRADVADNHGEQGPLADHHFFRSASLDHQFRLAHPQAGLDVAGAQAGPGFREDIAFARGTQVQDQFLPLLRRQGPEVPPEHISLRRCPGLGPGKIQPPGNLGADGNLGQGQVRGILDNESQVDRLTQTAGGRTNPFQAESCFLTTAQRTLRAGRR